jgi:hypothetical protein
MNIATTIPPTKRRHLVGLIVGVATLAAATSLPPLEPAAAMGTDPVVDTAPYAELSAIADYARAHGLSGLSPASLTPIATDDPVVDTAPYAELSAIADYARAHGLSGLSPASTGRNQ